jgi:hypothetical protein
MADTVQTDSSSLADSLAVGDSDAKKKLKELQKLAETSTVEADPEARKNLHTAVSDARSLYNTQATRNEWLEVAQNLAQAVAQFGAARQASSQGDTTSGVLGPMVRTDYGARTDRAAKEYGMSRDAATEDYKLGRDELKDRQSLAEKLKQDRMEVGKLGYHTAASEEAAARAEEARSREAALGRGATVSEGAANRANALAIAGMRHPGAGSGEKIEETQRQETLKEALQDKDRLLKKRDSYVQGSNLSGEDLQDALTSKKASETTLKAADILGKAGISLDEVKAERERLVAANSEPGTLYGTNLKKGVTEEQLNKQAMEIIQKRNIGDPLTAIQAKIDALQGRKVATTSAAATPESPKTLTQAQVDAYASKYNLSPEAAAAHLIKSGFTIGN